MVSDHLERERVRDKGLSEGGKRREWHTLSPMGLSFLLGGPEVLLLASPLLATPNELKREPDLPRLVESGLESCDALGRS